MDTGLAIVLNAVPVQIFPNQVPQSSRWSITDYSRIPIEVNLTRDKGEGGRLARAGVGIAIGCVITLILLRQAVVAIRHEKLKRIVTRLQLIKKIKTVFVGRHAFDQSPIRVIKLNRGISDPNFKGILHTIAIRVAPDVVTHRRGTIAVVVTGIALGIRITVTIRLIIGCHGRDVFIRAIREDRDAILLATHAGIKVALTHFKLINLTN